MSYTSNASTVIPHSRTDVSSAPGNTGRTASRLPHILTYCYDRRMVYVAPGEDYDQAIDIAIESFPELRNVARYGICLEINTKHYSPRRVGIGRTAWPFLVATLAPFDNVYVGVAPLPPPPPPPPTPPPPPPIFMPASSSSVVEFDSETGWPEYSKENTQTISLVCRAQMSSSLLHPRSHTTPTRVVVDAFPSSSPQVGHYSRLK